MTPDAAPSSTGVIPEDFFNFLHSRHSIRAFAPREIEETKLTSILDAAVGAPSAGNLRAYRITVIRSLASRAQLVTAALGQEFLSQAPIVLAFFADCTRSAVRYKERGRNLYALQDATIACAYAQLAAHALGLGSVWVGAFDDEAVARILEAKAEWQPVALLPIGYPAEEPGQTDRRPMHEIVMDEQQSRN